METIGNVYIVTIILFLYKKSNKGGMYTYLFPAKRILCVCVFNHPCSKMKKKKYITVPKKEIVEAQRQSIP